MSLAEAYWQSVSSEENSTSSLPSWGGILHMRAFKPVLLGFDQLLCAGHIEDAHDSCLPDHWGSHKS